MNKKAVLILLVLCAASSRAQRREDLRSIVTYVAGNVAYLGVGRVYHVAVGDTARIVENGKFVGVAIVAAIADSSSAARTVSVEEKISIGDSAIISVIVPEQNTSIEEVTNGTGSEQETSNASGRKVPQENVLSGRVALDYSGIFAEDSKFNLSQPAAFVQMKIRNLFGEGMTFSIYDQGFYSSRDNYSLYAAATGFQQNLYQVSLSGDWPSFGFEAGRLNSTYVGGLGTIDGAQAFYHVSDFTVGILGGAAASIPTSTLNFSGTRTAAFVNYRYGTDFEHLYDGTIAYGVQTVGGKLDRNYAYLQNSLSLGTDLSLYESTEIDMSKLSNGQRKTAFNFSNTYLSVNYDPADWLFANFGYDASRQVFLFQSMRSIPDSLIDRNILQGLRGSLSADLPGEMTLTATGTFRTQRDYARNEYSLGGSFRARDIFETGMDGNIEYTGMSGVYTNANDLSLELDRSFFYALSLTLRYDLYSMNVSTVEQKYTTQTLSGYLDYYISTKWYASFGVNDIIDATMNSFGLNAEIGFRF